MKIEPKNNSISNKILFKKKETKHRLNKFDKIKIIFKDWALASSTQCLPKLFQYENIFIRILWLVVLIIFSFGTVWFLLHTIFDYLAFDVVSQIRVYNQQSLMYPVITICHANPFTSKKAEEILKDYKSEDENVYESLNKEKILGNIIMQTLTSKFFYYLSYGMYKAFNMTNEEKLGLSSSLKSTIQLCTFDNQPCDVDSFDWFFHYLYGNCLAFNSKKVKHTKMSGPFYGLLIQVSNLTSHNKYPTYFATGLRVFVTNTSFLTQSSQQVYAETGKVTSIEIKSTLTYRQPNPYSQCQDLSEFKSELYDQIKKLSRSYSQTHCFELCLQRLIMKKCKCFSNILPAFDYQYFKPCFNTNQLNCSYLIILTASNNLADYCIPECPLECNSVRYELSSSMLTFPTEELFESLKNYSPDYSHMTLNEYKQTNLLLNVFYSSKEFTEIKEIPKITTIELISNLGGIVGIFLGLSIFTFIEIMELIFKLIFVSL